VKLLADVLTLQLFNIEVDYNLNNNFFSQIPKRSVYHCTSRREKSRTGIQIPVPRGATESEGLLVESGSLAGEERATVARRGEEGELERGESSPSGR
jgi:hypothetical protein